MKGLARLLLVILAFTAWVAGHIVPFVRRDARSQRHCGSVALVGAGPGSADLITLRGLERLRLADAVFFDRLADPALLAFARRDARLVDVGKAPGHHPVPQERINSLVVEAALAGQRVVRLKCGDPGIFGRGAEEAAACAAAGVPCEVVPGVTSASAAAASASGFLTERGQTDRVVLVTGHGCSGRSEDWSGLAVPGTTLVVYMGLAHAAGIAAGLLAEGWPPGAGVEIVSNAQMADERVLRVRLDALAAGRLVPPPAGPAVILVRWPLSLSQRRPERDLMAGAPGMAWPDQSARPCRAVSG